MDKDENKSTCEECKYMKIVPIEDYCGAAAKCFFTSKKGRTITWAMGTPLSSGTKRVRTFLRESKVTSWCPLKKARENNGNGQTDRIYKKLI